MHTVPYDKYIAVVERFPGSRKMHRMCWCKQTRIRTQEALHKKQLPTQQPVGYANKMIQAKKWI
jgi:hypothetical protein